MGKTNYDYTNLTKLIDDKFGKRKRFASLIGISETQLSKLLSNKASFSRETILTFMKALEIKPKYMFDYFFIRKEV